MDFTFLACVGIVCNTAYVAADMVKCRLSCNETSSARQFVMSVTFGVSCYRDVADVLQIDRFHTSLQLLCCPLQHTALHLPPV